MVKLIVGQSDLAVHRHDSRYKLCQVCDQYSNEDTMHLMLECNKDIRVEMMLDIKSVLDDRECAYFNGLSKVDVLLLLCGKHDEHINLRSLNKLWMYSCKYTYQMYRRLKQL